jgi:hypothetical protein
VLRNRSIDWIRKAVEYWVKMAQEPQREIQEKWDDYEKGWEKVNREMKDIILPEFVSLEEFIDLHNIVKQHSKQESTWIVEIEKVASRVPGQVQ